MIRNNTGRYWAIIAAAGSGQRFRQRKQHMLLAGKTVLEHALSCFITHSAIVRVVVVLMTEDKKRIEPDAPGMDKVLFVSGGKERCQSVLNGLLALADEADEGDMVLIHDAARPCLAMEDLNTLITAARDETGGALLAVPVNDSLKQTDPDSRRVLRGVPRGDLWRALTPQAFPYGRLLAGLRQALSSGHYPTDEAEAMEHAGAQAPLLVRGRSDNIKITYEDDLNLADAILKARACTA